MLVLLGSSLCICVILSSMPVMSYVSKFDVCLAMDSMNLPPAWPYWTVIVKIMAVYNSGKEWRWGEEVEAEISTSTLCLWAYPSP